MRSSERTAFILAIALTAFASARAQAAPPQPNQTTTLQVYSRLTVVDVTATDANGQPVYGLSKSDFKVFEDGKQQVIRDFEEVGTKPVTPPPPLPPGVYTDLRPESPSSAVNIILLDFLDLAPVDSTNPQQTAGAVSMQHYVKEAAIEAVQRMPAGTRIMVLLLTNNLRIVQSFTSDRELLAAAINAVPYDLDGNGDPQHVQSNSRNQSVLEALDRIAVDTAAIKRRKNLIWFTVGIPQITEPAAEPGSLPDYTSSLSHAYDLLTAAQVSIYPVSAIGVNPMGAAELSMEQVAEATGGIAYSETNDRMTPVLQALHNGANYYSIGYIPPAHNFDGAFHSINVKVDRPGIHLVFRRGYNSDDLSKIANMPTGLTLTMTPPAAVDDNMKAPMSRGLPTSQQILFDVAVNPDTAPPKPGTPAVLGTLDPKLKGKRLSRYTFGYSLPARQITFTDGPNGTHLANVEFDIAAFDSDDRRLTGLSQTVKASLSQPTFQKDVDGGQPIRFTQQIDLPPGQIFIRVGVLDKNSNQVGTLELPLKIDK